MTNTEAIVFTADGASSSAKNYYSTGYSAPTLSPMQSVTSTVDVSVGTIQMTTRRPINPGFENSFSIPLDSDINMGFGANDQTNSLSFQHNRYGSWVLNLPSDGNASGESGVTDESDSDGDSDSDDESNSDDDGDSDSDEDENDDRMRLTRLRACASTSAYSVNAAIEDESVNSARELTLNFSVLVLAAAIF